MNASYFLVLLALLIGGAISPGGDYKSVSFSPTQEFFEMGGISHAQ